MDIRKLQRAIVDGLEDVKAHNIVVFNTEHLSPLFERVIVASGKRLAVAEGWHVGPVGPPVASAADVESVLRPLLDAAAPNADEVYTVETVGPRFKFSRTSTVPSLRIAFAMVSVRFREALFPFCT